MKKNLTDFVLNSIRISLCGVHTKQYFEIKGQCVFLFFFFFFFHLLGFLFLSLSVN